MEMNMELGIRLRCRSFSSLAINLNLIYHSGISELGRWQKNRFSQTQKLLLGLNPTNWLLQVVGLFGLPKALHPTPLINS